jgi:hypothetical protein
MSKTKKWIAVTGAAFAVLMLLVVALPAAADTNVAAPAAHRGGPMGGGASDAYLAEALGIAAAELQTAQQTAYEAAIDQALTDGLITQAQADALKARGASFGRGFHGFFGLGDNAIDMNALLADALGISADELAAARVEAQDLALAAAVEDGRLTQEQADQLKARQSLQTYLQEQGFQDQVRSLYENLVQQAVQAGVLTQAQADAILSEQGAFGGMRGMRGFDGMRGHGGRMFGMPGMQAPDDTAPSGARQPGGFQMGGLDY